MKNLLNRFGTATPWIVTAVFGLWVLSSPFRSAPPASEFNFTAFGRLPVLLEGRIQPIDSVGRNALLMLRTKTTVPIGDGQDRKTLSATEWIAEVLMHPEAADKRKVFRIDHPEVRGLLSLPETEKYFSFAEIEPQWAEIDKQARRIGDIEAQLRTPFEKQLMKLNQGITLYFRLKNSVAPESSHDFASEIVLFQKSLAPGLAAAAQNDTTSSDLQVLSEFFKRYQNLARVAHPLIIPPHTPGAPQTDWKNIGDSLLHSLHAKEVHPAVVHYSKMASAFHNRQAGPFNQAVSAHSAWLAENFSAVAEKGRREFSFNQIAPFYKSLVIYVAAFILGCVSWINRSKLLNRTAFRLILLGFVVHTAGLIFRMVLEGRPPVTNLYSSAIFVGWGAVALGAILERIFRDGIGTVTAATVGFLTLLIAHSLSLDGDTMIMLRAVLDTNFWLATHVVVITLGYSSVFLAGFLGILYVLLGVLTKSLQASTAKSLVRMVYGITCFATLFSFVGTVLGGIWADQSWGRFWGWDPKENGALLIVIWSAIVLHARWGGMVRDRGLVNLAIFGNVVCAFSWFGVNMLGVGLHAYGFMDQAFKWLILFCISQLFIIGIGMLPFDYWKSFPGMNARSDSKTKPSRRKDDRSEVVPV